MAVMAQNIARIPSTTNTALAALTKQIALITHMEKEWIFMGMMTVDFVDNVGGVSSVGHEILAHISPEIWYTNNSAPI
jgi:hypothetical protein